MGFPLTLEDPNLPPVENDFAFVALGSANKFTLSSAVDGAPLLVTAPSSTGFDYHTNYRTFSFDFDQAGAYTLALGVVDVEDLNNASGLLLGSITVVPELPAYPTVSGSLLLFWIILRRVRGAR